MEELVLQPLCEARRHLSLQLLHVLVPRCDEVPLQNLQRARESSRCQPSSSTVTRTLPEGLTRSWYLQLLLLLDPLLLGVGDEREERPRLVLLVFQALGCGLLTGWTLAGASHSAHSSNVA